MADITATDLFLAVFLSFVLGMTVATAMWKPLCEKWEKRGDKYFWKWFRES